MKINCSHNPLTSLSGLEGKILREIDCSHCGLQNFDGVPAGCKIIGQGNPCWKEPEPVDQPKKKTVPLKTLKRGRGSR